MKHARMLAVIGLAFSLSFCDGEYEPTPEPPAPDSTRTEVIEVDTLPVEEGTSENVVVEPAQDEACVPSMLVNGEPAVVGGRTISFDKGTLPDLEITVIDCPHASEEARAAAAWAINYGGARTGYGSGEVHIVVLKRGAIPGEFSRMGSDRVSIDGEIVGEFGVDINGELFEDSGAWRSEGDQGADGPALFKGITAPSRRSTPTNRIDTPVAIGIDVDVSSQMASGADTYPVEIQLRFYSAAGHDKDMSLSLKERCSAEAQASPSRFDC